MESTTSTPRAGRWLGILGGSLLALGLASWGLWLWLPWWAPEWTQSHAPWVDPVARASVIRCEHLGIQYGIGFRLRVKAWGLASCPGLRACLDNGQPGMRQLAAQGLVDLAAVHPLDQATRDRLTIALRDPEPEVRAAARVALTIQKDPRVLPSLLLELGSPDWAERRMACIHLGMLGDGRAIPDLTTLASDPDERVRQEARRTVHSLQDPAPGSSP